MNRAQLSGAQLSGAQLSRAHLSGAKCPGPLEFVCVCVQIQKYSCCLCALLVGFKNELGLERNLFHSIRVFVPNNWDSKYRIKEIQQLSLRPKVRFKIYNGGWRKTIPGMYGQPNIYNSILIFVPNIGGVEEPIREYV